MTTSSQRIAGHIADPDETPGPAGSMTGINPGPVGKLAALSAPPQTFASYCLAAFTRIVTR